MGKTWKEVLNKELLQKFVLELGLDIDELEDITGASERTIRRALRQAGIPIKLVRKTSVMSVDDSKQIAKMLKVPIVPKLELEYIDKEPESEVLHMQISDLQVGQRLPTEEPERAKEYFKDSFDYFTENIFKVMSHVHHPIEEINVHMNGDILEGESIYHNQAYDSFHLKDQMNIAMRGFMYLFDSLKNFEVPINVYNTRGNHGRTGWKTADESNWDMVIARMLAHHYYQDEQLKFTFSDNKHLVTANKFGHRFLQTHGDYVPMYFNLPYYGLDKMIGGWVNIYGQIDAVLIGHFHVSSRIRPAGVPAFLNGCWRINDFPIDRMARVPTRCQWLFGSSQNRPITWSYEVDTEPPKYSNDLEEFLMKKEVI